MLKVLSTGFDNVKNQLVLNDLNFNSRTLDNLKKTLRNVDSLRLQITTRSNNRYLDEDEGEQVTFDKATAIKVAQDIASLMPSIEFLDLTLSYSAGSGLLCRNFINNMSISKLTTLRLDSVRIDAKSLGTIVLGLVNVETLFLEWIHLTKGTWPTILEALLKLKKLNHLHLNYLAVPGGAACFLKTLEPTGPPRDGAPTGWDLFGPFSLNGGGTGPGTAAAGAANPPLDDQGSGSSEFGTDEEDEDEDYDEDEEDEDEDEDEDYSDEDDDSMPELEPQTAETPAQPSQSPPSLTQVLSNLYPDSDAETDDSMPELEPQSGEASPQPATQPAPPLPAATASTAPNQNNSHSQHAPPNAPQAPPEPSSLEPRLGSGTERGRVVCLNTSNEIQELLPRLIKEYHIVDAEDDLDDDLLGGMPIAIPVGGLGAGATGAGNTNGAAPQPTTNAIMNHLHALANANGAGQGHGYGHGPALPPLVFGSPLPANTGAGGGGSEEEGSDDEDY